MCNGDGVACFHGACAFNATDKSTLEVCVCEDLYSGSQCGYRSGLLYFELPLASVMIYVFVVMGLRLSATAWAALRFPESKRDYFAFPRVFTPALYPRLGRLRPYIGTWDGPVHKQMPIKQKRPMTTLLVLAVILLELLPFVQIAAVAFLPVVPWSKASKTTAKFLSQLLLQPLWSHQKAHEYPQFVFYLSLAVVPTMLLVACVLGIKRFPLFKPQPECSPTEDLCTIALRVFSTWAILPVMVALLMPLECLFVGYLRRGSVIMIPVTDPVCFTWVRMGHIALGFGTTAAYNLVAACVAIQLNCESSNPQPTLWTDARYVWTVYALPAPLALSVVVFGNSNPLALCICVTLAGLCLAVLNAWLRPCIYSLVNWLRLYGAILASWSGISGIIASIVDDPLQKTTYEIWSLGAIALSAVSFSALFVYYTEAFWFKLSLFGGSKQGSPVRSSVKAASLDENLESDDPEEHPGPPTRVIVITKTLTENQLPPLHVLRKRSRRGTAQVEPETTIAPE